MTFALLLCALLGHVPGSEKGGADAVKGERLPPNVSSVQPFVGRERYRKRLSRPRLPPRQALMRGLNVKVGSRCRCAAGRGHAVF